MKIKRVWGTLGASPHEVTSTSVITKFDTSATFLWWAEKVRARALCLISRKKSINALASKTKATDVTHGESMAFLTDLGFGDYAEMRGKTGWPAEYVEVDVTALRTVLDCCEGATLRLGVTPYAFNGELERYCALIILDDVTTDIAVFISQRTSNARSEVAALPVDRYKDSPAWLFWQHPHVQKLLTKMVGNKAAVLESLQDEEELLPVPALTKKKSIKGEVGKVDSALAQAFETLLPKHKGNQRIVTPLLEEE